MPLDATPMPRATAPAALAERRHRAPFWRGAAGAIRLAAWSLTGVIGAALALLPVVLEPGPRGRARSGQLDASLRRLGEPVVALELEDPAADDRVPARAAGEAFPR